MFEAAQLGRKASKEEFEAQAPALQTALLQAQQAIRAAEIPVIVVVAGVEGSGKGEVVNRLHEWLDPRGLRTHAFWDHTDEEAMRPRHWRFWTRLPPRGMVGIMFGSWYTQPIIDRVFERATEAEYERELRRIEEFERLLTDDGALIVKLWFHLSKQEQKKRLQRDVEQGRMAHPLLKKFAKKYDRFVVHCERALRMTDTGHCPWTVVEAGNRRHRDLSVGRTLLQAMRERLERGAPASVSATAPASDSQPGLDTGEETSPRLTVLDRVELGQTLTVEEYEARQQSAQDRLGNLAWAARKRGINTVAVFEGWDAAGKGGAIRRVARAIDARLFQTISIAAPTDEERAHHYLWRFWRHVPRAGYMTIYDRSWYGRVLVERVEGFARTDEWRRAYQEINDFEEQLGEHGVVLMKFWLHVSPQEQLRRFEERAADPRKQHKLTPEDWRNRDKRRAYEEAVDDMVARTSTALAPWTLVAGDDKRFARVQVLETFVARLSEALGE
ncbi:MAG: polyphosphate:AMP phosphotransferase [Myxococcales bacterium]|nr:polyphosphate:AMP phosphotransferase [Myxococcales bacterium]MCB9717071.1 polyphosphate:AMP phosphotransferase [Myxococcales bacterium]